MGIRKSGAMPQTQKKHKHDEEQLKKLQEIAERNKLPRDFSITKRKEIKK